MQAFLYGIFLQWKLDLRNREIIIVYYIVPLVFFAFMGGIFTTINPIAYKTVIASMVIFGVTMGAYLGTPVPLVQMYGSEMKKSYKVGGIPLWTAAFNNFISACIHLFIMSLIIIVIAPIVFDATMPENIGLFLFSIMIFIMVCTAIGTVLGLLVKSASKLTMISQVLFLPSIMLSGIMFPNELLPDVLVSVGKIFPATWAYQCMQLTQFDMNAYLPLIIIGLVSVMVCAILLKRVEKER